MTLCRVRPLAAICDYIPIFALDLLNSFPDAEELNILTWLQVRWWRPET